MSIQNPKVLVSGVAGDAGIGVVRALRSSKLKLQIHGANNSAIAAGFAFTDYSHVTPPVDSQSYLESLVKLVDEREIDIYIPAIDAELQLISQIQNALSKFGNSKVLSGATDLVQVFTDKWLTQTALGSFGIERLETIVCSDLESIGKVRSNTDSHGDWILKPRTGAGSRGIVRLHSWSELDKLVNPDSFVIQRRLSDAMKEFTIGVYISPKGAVHYAGFWRTLRNGSTYSATEIDMNKFPEIQNLILKFSKSVGTGYWNLQGKAGQGEVRLFEVNPRFSGTTYLVSRYFNAPAMWVSEELSLPFNPQVVPEIQVRNSTFVRYQEFVEISEL